MMAKSKESQILTSNLNTRYVNVTRLPLSHRLIHHVIPSSSCVLKESPPSVRVEMREQALPAICRRSRSLHFV